MRIHIFIHVWKVMCSHRVAVNDMYICEGTNKDIYVYIWKDMCSMIL